MRRRDFLGTSAAFAAFFATKPFKALAQTAPRHRGTDYIPYTGVIPEEIDKHVIIPLDMSGSVNEFEAAAMQRAWKDAVLAKFPKNSESKLTYAFTVVAFNNAPNVEATFYVRTRADAIRFVNDSLWNIEEDKPVPHKETLSNGTATNIHGVLRAAASVFRRHDRLTTVTGKRVVTKSRDVAFMLDGWQTPYDFESDTSRPRHLKRNDRTIKEARIALEQLFGASVHAVAAGRLEGVINRRTGFVFGWGETYGSDIAKSIEEILVTPKGISRPVTTVVKGREYSDIEHLRAGLYERSVDFKGTRNPHVTLQGHLSAILSLDGN